MEISSFRTKPESPVSKDQDMLRGWHVGSSISTLISKGDPVIVETENGLGFGTVAVPPAMVEDDPVNDSGGHCLALPCPTQAAARAFASGIGEPKSISVFLALGFREA